MRIAYFDCFAGISGDMTLGALVSAGWDRSALESLPRRLKLDGVRVSFDDVKRGPFHALQVKVEVAEARQPHRHLRHVEQILEQAELDEAPRARALAIFQRLAEAEAEVHGSTIEKVHFHEVGAADALVDVAGAAEGLAALGIERVFASAPRLGGGEVMSQHGRIPVPAPATVALLRGAPVELGPIASELTTPTGAALLATLVESWAAPPAFRLERTGIGAGSRDPKELANVLRVLVGTVDPAKTARQQVAVLETSLDDENPQLVGALLPRLLAAGALDAMVVPTVMKKGRPGLWLVVIAPPDRADELGGLLLRESSTLGVRMRIEERLELERRTVSVSTSHGPVTLKIARLPDGTERAVPEFESVREVAERSGQPHREVAESAIAAWRAGRGAS
ncbi:MAG TPA: nickel pincer cofactor biosynthesis protein LarC [Candidatus Sulfotelmatobacter sp.]|nr:nickel pincer cofactor biosynthesis protein LarC [Candidatus Sulfotelmatobacter sp.]